MDITVASIKKHLNVSSIIQKAKTDIEAANIFVHGPKYIPDIITFCNSPEYLNLEQRGIFLRPFQRIILKVFYRGSKGNENLGLTEKEIELCRENGLDNDNNGNILAKYLTKETFRELVLVWGRRGGKDFQSSLIAIYEAMKLLECEGGDPYAIYSLAPSMPISILTIATASKQADIAFQEIKDKVLNSKYFRDKIGPDGVESYKICLLTDKDKIDNQDRIERKLPLKKGSILIEVGHSNSDSLIGKGVFVLILDEVASYKKTGGSSSGERMYSAMSPSLNSFHRKIKTFDEYGFEKTKTMYDSKMISISSPREAAGVFYGLFRDAPNVPDRLTCRLPTWILDKDKTEESLREANRHMPEEEFLMEFGAEFSGTGGETFFPRQKVEECFSHGNKLVNMGKPGVVYFAHLDPATSSHNYALVIVHREMFYNQRIKQNDFNIVADHIKHWHPLPDQPINCVMVDEYILSLRRKFYFGLVTYDVWNSKESIKKLRKVGIPSKSTHYTKKYKMMIYDELYDLIVSGKLKIPPYLLLRDEMLNIQRKFTAPTGYSVFPKREGDVTTDDCLDSLAGACYNAICYSSERLPLSSTVQISSTPSSNSRLWQSMSGPLGYGTGKQVADRLERINSWPNYKRLGINEMTKNRR